MRWVSILFMLFALAAAPRAELAEESVDLALVLLTDVSRSVDEAEYALIKKGYAAALTDARVLAAIRGGAVGAVAFIYVEFAGSNEVRTLVDWTVVRDAASAEAFAARITDVPRSAWGRTAISSGIEHAMRALASSGLEAQRRVIDVCADGTNNSGRDVPTVRDEAVAAGLTINALVILSEPTNAWTAAHVQPPGGLTNYFRANVIGGIGAFAIEVEDFASFGAALTRKLINEIAGTTPDQRFARNP